MGDRDRGDKPRRGRTFKSRRLDSPLGETVGVLKEQNLKHCESASPGLGDGNGNRLGEVDQSNGVDDRMVGQVVRGVADVVFEDGYLIKVRAMDSKEILRGIVLKPGHYVPISDDGDVAPDVRFFKRNEIPLPQQSYIQDNDTCHREENWTAPAAKHLPSMSSPLTSTGLAVTHPLSGLTPANGGSRFNNQMGEWNGGLASKVPAEDRSLLVEHLQAVQPVLHNHAIESRNLTNTHHERGRMDELLQVLQASLIEREKTKAYELGSSLKHEPETDHGTDDGFLEQKGINSRH